MTWQDTAKKLAKHPRWEWREGVLCRIGPTLAKRTCRRSDGLVLIGDMPEFFPGTYPDLTDWPTVGVLLGMVMEATLDKRGHDPYMPEVELDAGWAMDVWNGQAPGDVLAERLLELWGDE